MNLANALYRQPPDGFVRARKAINQNRNEIMKKIKLSWQKLLLAVLAGLALAMAQSGLAAILTVVNLNDEGPSSLRGTIDASAAGDTIIFAPGLSRTITITEGSRGYSEIRSHHDLTILGPTDRRITVDGNHAHRVFSISDINISNLTIANGYGDGNGGAMLTSGSVTLNNCTLWANGSANSGGAIWNVDALAIVNCTISGSNAGSEGGAIENFGDLRIYNCTIASNTS